MSTEIAKEYEPVAEFIPGDSAREEGRMDKGTLMGVLSGIILIAIAIFRGGESGLFINMNGALIVLGGTFATTFIAFPAVKIRMMIPVVINAFKPDTYHPADYVDEIINLSTKYRSGGGKNLEIYEGFVKNRYLRNGVAMIVDGYSTREIYEIMDRELLSLIERHNAGQKILRFMAVQAPVFGMCGTLIGLIQMLINVNDPSTIGPSLATALITTFYGLILANLVITPIVAKLSSRTESEAMLYKALRVGILGIHERVNPHKIRKNMNSLLPPDQQR